jgi:hypothetical protein
MSKSDAFPGLSTLDALGITAPDRASKRTSTKVTARVEAIAQGFGKGRAVIVTGDKGAPSPEVVSGVKIGGKAPAAVHLEDAGTVTVAKVKSAAAAFCRENPGAEFAMVRGAAVIVKPGK